MKRDDAPPLDPFGRTQLPSAFDRAGRVRMLGEVFEALLDGREVPPPAAAFVGAAGLAWLEQGGTLGSLERDYLRVTQPRRSTVTPSRLWRELKAGGGSTCRATDEADDATMPLDATEDDAS